MCCYKMTVSLLTIYSYTSWHAALYSGLGASVERKEEDHSIVPGRQIQRFMSFYKLCW